MGGPLLHLLAARRRVFACSSPGLLACLLVACLLIASVSSASVGLALAPTPPPGDDLGALEVALRDSNKFVRKDAVEDLAERAEPEAWSLLVDALGDPAGEVADSAAFFLAGLPAPERDRAFARLRDDLMGKRGLSARSVQVRRYAAELLGRVEGPLDGDALVGALRDDDADVRRLALWTLERRADAGHAPEDADEVFERVVRALERDDDPLVRARALHAAGALARASTLVEGTELLTAWRAAATDRQPAVRAAAALLAGDLASRGGTGGLDGADETTAAADRGRSDASVVVELLVRLAEDEALAVRTASATALEHAARAGDTPAVRKLAAATLAGRLELEPTPVLALRLVEHLRGLSALKYGRDPRPWRDWAADLPDDWAAAPLVHDEERPDVGAGDRSATLVGLPIRSRAVAFLIDFSGSAWREREDGRTVKEVLDERLREALEALPEDTAFLLVPFTGEPHPWQDRLEPATRRNVQRALSWFEDARFQGTGDAWEALLLAQDTPGVDTIVLLGDGAPSGGERYRLELLTALFAERNLGRQVVLDCVLVDTPRRLQRFWGDLCRSTGGRALAVEL